MVKLGHNPDNIGIAYNVSGVTKHLRMADEITETTLEARNKLGYPEKFTVLYIGYLESEKKPELLFEAAQRLDPNQVQFLFLGSGPLLEPLRSRTKELNLKNVHFPGYIKDELAMYFRAGNLVVIPGWGGMLLSESMSHRLPVMVHKADGAELDLIRHRETGWRLQSDSVDELVKAIRTLAEDPQTCESMGQNGRQFIETQFNEKTMCDAAARMIRHASDVRQLRN
jgi:glycosyltransferase involved in cell wall biosynthesis